MSLSGITSRFLEGWEKPVIYIAGNHGFYTKHACGGGKFREWISDKHPNAHFPQDRCITIDGVHFFRGTMRTDFPSGSEKAMLEGMARMNGFRLIKMGDGIANPALHRETTQSICEQAAGMVSTPSFR
ncbi:MAG: hypothetical protein OXD29_06795 [Roseovarius sp.]|nr:hypothetical protein [Roseovarius sp.]MCY4207644.1 hypothetical protein [Roseovarius sp.]MCY4316947.1 hypothetical protein [Roseovarius sp.]